MATQTLNVIFDGTTDVARLPGRSAVSWDDGSIGYYNVFYSAPNPGDDLDATANFTGSGWRVKTLRIAGDDNLTTIRDLDNGSDRRVDFLELGYNSDVDLISTRARFIFGWDGDTHEVTLGNRQDGGTSFIGLYAKENSVTTGNAYVSQIETGGAPGAAIGDTIKVGSGGVGMVQTGRGNDSVTTTNGFVGSIRTGGGNDTVKTGSERVETISTSDGNDKVTVGAGGADLVKTSDGNDTVTIGTGGAELVKTSDGKDKVVAKGFVGSIDTGTGNDRVTVNQGADLIKTGDGRDTVITKAGYASTIITGNDNDKVTVGKGGAGLVRTGDGDDTIVLNEMPGTIGVVVQGGSGTDTLSFARFKSGVTVSLDEGGAFMNVGRKDITDPTPTKGYVAESSIENLVGTSKADRLMGDNNSNLLNGGKGNDVLAGLGGDDILRGGAGKDVFDFGAAGGSDRVADYEDGVDLLRIADHSGGFKALDISTSGGDAVIGYDGGTIILDGAASVSLSRTDFDFV